MLISFSVRNFRSLYERQDLTLSASKFSSHNKAVFRTPRVPGGVLPVVAIYGANASGKSNVLRAMHYLYEAVRNSHNRWEPEAKLYPDTHFFHKDEPSEFECVFLLQKELYRFGFSLNEDQFLTEYLYSGKNLVYRRRGNRYRIGGQLQDVHAIKRSTRKNSLFISTAAQNNHPLLKKIHAWFSSWDTITDDRTMEEAFAGYVSSDDNARSFLASAMRLLLPDVTHLESDDLVLEGEDDDVILRDRLKWLQIKFVHQSADGKKYAKLSLAQESKGTQSYFTLANSIAWTLIKGSVLLLDEADQSLHPTLLHSIVMLFHDPKTNPNRAQLILNTHDTTLLTPEVMRPDEVWFVDRGPDLESHLYSLSDFEGIRSETRVQRSYLEGRFGALPFLEDQEKIFATYIELFRKGRHAKA